MPASIPGAGISICRRLTTVNGVTYSWDNNGNLLNDGAKSYSYDQANRLKQVVQGAITTTFAYNGVGDRLSQTVGAATTHYVLDPAAGLTQVLADGTNTYLYGNDRLAQYQAAMQYFGADGLGSVRQIFDASAAVVGTSRYDPFGNVMSQSGTATSVFAFAGEQQDATGLTYLRARYYSSAQGRFTTRDVWPGNDSQPQSINSWAYVEGNPMNYVDPLGLGPDCPQTEGRWEWGCGAVQYVDQNKQAFLDSAQRHNRIPTMDRNGFAALIAAVIVNEGKLDEPKDATARAYRLIEEWVANFGCIVSGTEIEKAFAAKDYGRVQRYLTNEEIPPGPAIYALASVGPGNVKLFTASNLWRGVACGTYGDCLNVQVNKLQTTTHLWFLSWDTDLDNPFGSKPPSIPKTQNEPYNPAEKEAYIRIRGQLVGGATGDQKATIEYVAANLEAGALRASTPKIGLEPTAFNSAAWHMKGAQTQVELEQFIKDFGLPPAPGGPSYVVETIPIALRMWGLNTTWNKSMEKEYAYWKSKYP